MNLAEMSTEVIALTRRPDLATLITANLKAATLKAHNSDYYYKDIFEASIQFPTSEILQTFNYTGTFPRWRALKYLRKVDPTTFVAIGPEYTVITPEQIFDAYGLEKPNVVYVAGLTLQIKSLAASQIFAVGFYQYPLITPDASYSSWIANEFPWAIIYDCAATVFKTTGNQEQEAAMRGLYAEQINQIKLTNIQAVGY